jgi:hypothetical protein
LPALLLPLGFVAEFAVELAQPWRAAGGFPGEHFEDGLSLLDIEGELGRFGRESPVDLRRGARCSSQTGC